MDSEVSVEDIVPVVREVEESKHAELIAQATERRPTRSRRKSPATAAHLLPFNLSNMLVALYPLEQSLGLQFTTTSHPVHRPASLEKADPLAKERRRRLLELTEQAFPGGRVPAPFTLAWLATSWDPSINRLPFILATRIVVTSVDDQTANPPQDVFRNVWCLWDTGAHISMIATHSLDPAVRNNRDEGSLIMEIWCAPPCDCDLVGINFVD